MKNEHTLGDLLEGAGTFLTGIAACAAVWVAKDPVTAYFSKVSQTQTVVVNICEAKKQADELIQKSKDPEAFERYFKQIPAELSMKSDQPTGLFIAPEFRENAKKQVQAADSPEAKRLIIKNYWEKSLSKETKSTVDLKLNGD